MPSPTRPAQLKGAAPRARPTVDTADGSAMDAVGEEVADRFGAVHSLCNNAGVSITGPHVDDDRG